MEFHYAQTFGKNSENWAKLDAWLQELSEQYPQEFSKDIYQEGHFMAIGSSSTYHAIIFNPHPDMPEYIEKAIRDKLNELWPPY